MPIEIRELVIRTVVSASGEDDDDEEGAAHGSPLSETDTMVQECVRQVLRILRKERER